MLRRSLLVEWWLTGLLVSAVICLAIRGEITRPLDNLFLDVAARAVAPPADDRILIVGVDNASLAKVGKWPWRRSVHAALIRRLAASGAAVIAYDVLFTEAGPAQEDRRLETAMRAGTPVLLPLEIQTPGANGRAYDVAQPIPSLLTAAGGVGSVGLLFDEDGIVRRAALSGAPTPHDIPHLMEMTYRRVSGRPSPEYDRVRAGWSTGGRPVSWTPYLPAGGFRTISFASVLDGETPDVFLRGRIVLVGATALGLGDTYPVPRASGHVMPGVEIQANLLNDLLADRFIHPVPGWAAIVASLAPLWLLMVGFRRFRPEWNMRLCLAVMAGWLCVAWAMPFVAGLWLAPGAALLGLLIVYPLWGWRRLEALNRFVLDQLARIRREPDILPSPPRLALDTVDRDAARLGDVLEQLVHLRRFVAQIVAGIPDIICVLDADGRIRLANGAATQLFGADLKGQDFAAILARAARPIENGEMLETADGRTLSPQRVPFTPTEGDVRGWIVRLADVTPIRAAAQERERTLQFLSHDMRAPQSALIALLDKADSRALDPDIVRHIRRHAHATLELAENFVQLARANAATGTLQPVDPADALDEAADRLWSPAEAKGVTIEVEADHGHLVAGDQPMLIRAFANLLDNAVKFSPAGSTIRCTLEREGDQVRCTIADQGPGIPPERRQMLFAAFGPHQSGAGGGTGLGLAFVKAVVDRHGGAIAWRSEDGKGACFRLSLPALE